MTGTAPLTIIQSLYEASADGGETVVVLGRYSGTCKATGRAFRAPFAHVRTVRDGRAVRYVQYTDTLLAHRAVE